MISPDWLKTNYNQSSRHPHGDGPNGKIQGGVWERINGKSLVWYPKKAFDEAGYKTPTSYDELKALEQQIVKDGDAPWCIGIESGAATGWAATDWMEEIMLRTTSLENYDKWTRGELPFSSPEVKNAATEMARIWFDDKLVYGGRKSIATTSFGDAPKAMFDEDGPKCWLHKQGNFITCFFPPDVKAGVDYDFFYLPGIDAELWQAVLVRRRSDGRVQRPPEVPALSCSSSPRASISRVGWLPVAPSPRRKMPTWPGTATTSSARSASSCKKPPAVALRRHRPDAR